MEQKSFYSMNVDYSNVVLSGKLRVVGKIESTAGFKYKIYCDPSLGGCGCTGQTVTARVLAQTEIDTLRCANAGCGRTAENQTTRAHVEVRQKVEIVSSPRQRLQDRQRQEELDALEGGE